MSNEEDYWKRQWDQHESDKAIVDVDVRGWIYNPQRGPHGRKHRLMIGVARQVLGLPAPKSGDNSGRSSRNSSPSRNSKQEEDLINFEADYLVQHGNAEAERAQRGAFNESSNLSGERGRQVSDTPSAPIGPIQKRESWAQPANMTAAELATANAHLLTRLKPFLATGVAEQPISAFFYNDKISRQRTVYTDASGHFSVRAPLDFIPTHVRVLAGEGFSATEEVNITTDNGVSLISDIDDTIKHSNISGGAREIFRNAFIRDLGDMTIDGVREWYNTMHDMGVKIHYVSNSPWQVYPVLSSFFKLAGLPAGSFHLKQYSGALQGIFEPVAERKKGTLDRLMRDFPDRRFILVGDSGEADLEVYTDVVLDNPGRILGVFIRDVTTPVKSGYFDPSNGTGSGKGSKPNSTSHSRNHSRTQSGDSLKMSKRLQRPDDIRDDDADLKAAIANSLQDMEEEMRQARQSINPDAHVASRFFDDGRAGRPALPARLATSPGAMDSHEEDLIDFSEQVPQRPQMHLSPSDGNIAARRAGLKDSEPHRHTPALPPKPQALRRSDGLTSEPGKPSPPPRPSKPSSAVKPSSAAKPPSPQPPVHQPSPLSQVTTRSVSGAKQAPPLPARRGEKKASASKKEDQSVPGAWQSELPLNSRPKPSGPSYTDLPRNPPPGTFDSMNLRPVAPPPAPRRQGSSSNLSFTTSARKSTWSDDGLPGSPGDGMGKKEYLWSQRWAKAKAVMDRHGVTLRTWRVGSDVADVCVKLAEMELREIEKGNKGGNGRKG